MLVFRRDLHGHVMVMLVITVTACQSVRKTDCLTGRFASFMPRVSRNLWTDGAVSSFWNGILRTETELYALESQT